MAKISELVLLTQTPFNTIDYERYGIETLRENGFEVDVWDLTPCLYPQAHRQLQLPDAMDYERCRQFSSLKQVLAAISELTPSCFVVSTVSYRYESCPVYRALAKVRVGYAVVATNTLPSVQVTQTPMEALRKLRRSSSSQVLNALFFRIPFRWLGIRRATVAVAGGAQSFLSNFPVNQETQILWAHNLDYDIYLKEKEKPGLADTTMGVFLDEYLPFHPDFDYLKLESPASPKEYYPAISRFFDSLESTYGVRIVVAAHPRSSYKDHPDYFGGRAVFRGRTAELVKRSGFVIAHASTSIGFAVLFEKPVLFVTTDKLQQNPWIGRAISVMASWLNKTPINLDTALHLDWKTELAIDQVAYGRYREAFIKKNGSPEKPCWQIFADWLSTLDLAQV